MTTYLTARLDLLLPIRPVRGDTGICESYLITQFILNEYGDDAIQAIIAAYRDGASHDDVLREALGMTLRNWQAGWANLRRRDSFDLNRVIRKSIAVRPRTKRLRFVLPEYG